jgi:hypothetical protein
MLFTEVGVSKERTTEDWNLNVQSVLPASNSIALHSFTASEMIVSAMLDTLRFSFLARFSNFV